jgi:hypothetical protein
MNSFIFVYFDAIERFVLPSMFIGPSLKNELSSWLSRGDVTFDSMRSLLEFTRGGRATFVGIKHFLERRDKRIEFSLVLVIWRDLRGNS